MSTFGIVVSIIVIAVVIFYIGFNVGANIEFTKNCEFEERYEAEKRKRIHYQKIAENPVKILNVKAIGYDNTKGFTIKE